MDKVPPDEHSRPFGPPSKMCLEYWKTRRNIKVLLKKHKLSISNEQSKQLIKCTCERSETSKTYQKFNKTLLSLAKQHITFVYEPLMNEEDPTITL